ncbi:TPA_asm: DnaB-like replicative helicase [Caudoviricetes sp. vir526]|nr:TPA_asm: DnaB-like replicative helicase [Caudoviricetes sp. vir526]
MNKEIADGVEPTLGVLRDSGSIEQDADRVILLHEKKQGENDYRSVSAIVAKNRHGACGRVELMFDGKHVRFEQGSGA